ncbi:hypothetical protein [Streptomyces palmae]|uniref:Uncharacterized protein n=1 Tax=Streptomyces palmae TaxID=1701085 RepID=A0A4Z0H6T1_9ACTN|nr:hypothetical protein [Streptomyces palmae]TGB08703.1 hypothetical protein E4099_15000 [Streptomyces palmae]
MANGQVVRRGVRLGVRIGMVPSIFFGSIWLAATGVWLLSGLPHGGLSIFLGGLTAVGGTMAVGVLLGAVTGGVLALSPEWLAARAPLRGLLAGAVASTVFLGETLVVGLATDGSPAGMVLTLLSTPLAGAAAAAHSGDVLGRTHYHPWVWGERRAG